MRHILRLLSLICLAVSTACAAPLRAGIAKIDITPPLGTRMWGYFDRNKGAEGVIDPLYARVLVLEAGGQRIGLVSLDLGRTFGPASLAELRATARRDSGITYLLVAATHTHAGPVIQDVYGGGRPAWETADLAKIESAIHDATQHMVDAQVGTGYGSVYIGYNRRRVNPDGTVTMLWTNTTHVPTSPVDPTVSILRIDSTAGKPIAVLVHYACHPVVFGSDNLRFSADYPAVTTHVVEQAMGNQPLCFFLQGAPGDINPFRASTPLQEDVMKAREDAGRALGQEAARVANSIRTDPESNATLAAREDIVNVALRWDPEKFRQALLKSIGPDAFDKFAPPIRPQNPLPVTVLLLNRKIAWMTMPGEPFVDYQISWRDRCPLNDAFFLGYANGYNGYFPTIKAASEGGYGAASSTTWTEVGAGNRMVNHALVMLYEMLGRLKDMPEDLQ